MLFDIGWPELLLIGVVALVFIGPKDLPRALRVAGYWVGRARTLSREFQSSIDQMIRDAELEEIRQDLKKATEFDIEREFQKTVDPAGDLAQSIKPPEIPDYFEPASAQPVAPDPAALPEEALPASAEAVESTPAETGGTVVEAQPAPAPEGTAVPFDAGAPIAVEPSPEKVPVAREPEPPKP
jgi:sec-independent protein translocase protein TatB